MNKSSKKVKKPWRYFLDKKEVSKEVIDRHTAYGIVDDFPLDKIRFSYSVEYSDHFRYYACTGNYMQAKGT